MEQHHRHYMVFGQALILLALLVLSQGGMLASKLVMLSPAIITISLVYVCVKLLAAVIKMTMPNLADNNPGHMHGSMLPVIVFEPDY